MNITNDMGLVKEKKLIVSIIGVRGYPSDFEGTSGVEAYIQRVLEAGKVEHFRNILFRVYVKSLYSDKSGYVDSNIKVTPTLTIRSKVFESVIYGFLSSAKACFDGSRVVWYQGTGMALFSWLPRIFGKKIVLTIHGNDWDRKKWNDYERLLFRLVTRIVLFCESSVVVVSDKMRKLISRQFDVDSVVVFPGYSSYSEHSGLKEKIADYGLKDNSYLLYIGRLVPEKRIELLLNSYALVERKANASKLVIVGSHGNMPSYEQKLRSKYSKDNIVWTGFVEEDIKHLLLSKCSLFVLPSEVEGGNPLSFLEALGHNKYCLVPSGSVTKNFSSLRNVAFFKKNSKASFKNNLRNIILTQASNKKFSYSREEREVLRKYSWLEASKKYGELFSKLVK